MFVLMSGSGLQVCLTAADAARLLNALERRPTWLAHLGGAQYSASWTAHNCRMRLVTTNPAYRRVLRDAGYRAGAA